MPVDSGLLFGSALANALTSGIQSYRDAQDRDLLRKDREEEKLLRKKAYQAGLLEHGFVENPEGGFDLSPMEMEKRKSEGILKNKESKINAYRALPEEVQLSPWGQDLARTLFDNSQPGLMREPKGGAQDPNYYKPVMKPERLTPEAQAAVSTLTQQNVKKISIANQIESALDNWDQLPKDQQLSRGRQLLKVLNSPEGQDAVGAEESRRLGEKLEFAMGNLFNDNPMRLGRDLPGFKQQAEGTMDYIRKGVDKNAEQVSLMQGRPSVIPKQYKERPAPGASGWDESKESRLQELLKKQSQGTLGK